MTGPVLATFQRKETKFNQTNTAVMSNGIRPNFQVEKTTHKGIINPINTHMLSLPRSYSATQLNGTA